MSRQLHGSMKALTIRLEDETFALPAESVREILDLVPVADMRVMFDMQRPAPDQDTRIVVIEIETGGEPTIVGILADKVYEVTDIDAASIEEAPRVGMRWRPEFVRGIGKRNGNFLVIPDLNRIFETAGAANAPTAHQEERLAS